MPLTAADSKLEVGTMFTDVNGRILDPGDHPVLIGGDQASMIQQMSDRVAVR